MRLHFITSITVLVTLISYSQALESPAAPAHATLEARDTSEDGWINLSVGVRMKRDESSAGSIEKRSESGHSTPVFVKRDPQTGKIAWPSTFAEALRMAKRDLPEMLKSSLHRRTALVRRTMRVVITWYTGHDLLNPACFPDSANWAPTDDSMVAAVTIDWPGKPKCGNFVRIQHGTENKKHIVVRIVDSCGGCAPGKPHIDLTTSAFEKLYDQDVGMVEGLKAKVIPCPQSVEDNWSSDDIIGKYGPRDVIETYES